MDLNHDISCQSWPLVNHGQFEAKQSLLLRDKPGVTTLTGMTEKQDAQVMRADIFGTLSSHPNFSGIAHAALS